MIVYLLEGRQVQRATLMAGSVFQVVQLQANETKRKIKRAGAPQINLNQRGEFAIQFFIFFTRSKTGCLSVSVSVSWEYRRCPDEIPHRAVAGKNRVETERVFLASPPQQTPGKDHMGSDISRPGTDRP